MTATHVNNDVYLLVKHYYVVPWPSKHTTCSISPFCMLAVINRHSSISGNILMLADKINSIVSELCDQENTIGNHLSSLDEPVFQSVLLTTFHNDWDISCRRPGLKLLILLVQYTLIDIIRHLQLSFISKSKLGLWYYKIYL